MSEIKAAKLTASQIDLELKRLPDWKLNAFGEIEKTFTLPGFPQSLVFVGAVGLLAEARNHHPDILIQWNKVRLSLSTHDAGGLTVKDFDLARELNALPGLSER
jgi:4a-hydroxytetrahydrobiopterin dehydratase